MIDNSAQKVDYFFNDVSTSTTYKFFHTNVAADSYIMQYTMLLY
jgi:hypothetical protein